MRALAFALALCPLPAFAFEPVVDRATFESLIAGKELRLGMMGIYLNVMPDGSITGSAAGWDVTGTWDWVDGHFCREMDWSGTPVPYNCQLVEHEGNQMRFTVDKGEGDSATFTLR
jgi:hypothetical protein